MAEQLLELLMAFIWVEAGLLMPVEAGGKTNTLKVVIATEKATECAESNLFWHAEFGYPKIGTDAKWSRVPFASHSRPGLE